MAIIETFLAAIKNVYALLKAGCADLYQFWEIPKH